MGLPARKVRPIKRATVRVKGKPRTVDLSKSGVGLGKVRIDVIGDRGNKVVEIVAIEEDDLESQPPIT